jgi:heptosyltransferase-3
VSAGRQPNLLIFRVGSIGDTVVALPCFHAIERAYPDHRRILLTNALASARASSVESVLEGTNLIHEAMYFPIGEGKLKYSVALASRLRQLQADALVYLTPRPTGLPVYRDLLFFRAAGIRRILGAPLRASTRSARLDVHTGQLEFEAERLARLLGASFPVNLSASSWDLHLSADERARALERLAALPARQPILALAPGAKVPVKDWGEPNWAALIKLLDARIPSISLVFVGAPDERPLTERLARLWKGDLVNVCGELSPRESAALLARSDILVCHDSGPMHLAASQGTVCVALFGNLNRPRQWFPYGIGHRVIYEARGVQYIEPRTVFEATRAALRTLTDTATSAAASDIAVAR